MRITSGAADVARDATLAAVDFIILVPPAVRQEQFDVLRGTFSLSLHLRATTVFLCLKVGELGPIRRVVIGIPEA